MNLRLPNITGATVGERLEQVVRYLFSLVNDLNFALGQREQEKLQQTAESERTEENNRLRPKSVTTDILADGAVTNDKIADGTIDKSKLSFSTDLIAGSGIAVEGRKISTAAAPYNLLDNSDFRNPVNQRGQGSYSGATYTIDRWRTWDSSAVVTLNSNGITISADALWQYLKETTPESGKTYTAAVKLADGTISVASGVLQSTGYSFGNEHFSVGIDENNKSLYFGLKGGSYVWAALYIGEFTADTLPLYQSRGYAAELVECMRYYELVRGGGAISHADYSGAKVRLGFSFFPKRVTPSIGIIEFWSPGYYGQSQMGNLTVDDINNRRATIISDNAGAAGLYALYQFAVSADI